LCSGIGGHAAQYREGAVHIAYRPNDRNPARARLWKPGTLPDGAIVAFHGYFDNSDTIAAELGVSASDSSTLYGLAVARWGDAADLRINGEYCAAIANPVSGTLRLSRSPLRAPPLCYSVQPEFVAAASVPRALFSLGVPKRLNEQRLADSAMLHFSDEETGWFHETSRVPIGSIVELRPDQPRELRRYYDMARLPDVRMGSDAEYIAKASELFDEAVRTCIAGTRKPGNTLSSGLDSSQVAVRTLKALGPGARLPTFTFHPEAGWDGIAENGMLGNERPWVEEFAAMHPGLDPHFTDNAGYANDHRWPEMFHLMDGAPSGACNMYLFHGIYALARDQGCDRLLIAEWGNYTFSDKGEWAFVELLLRGRWRKLWQALREHPNDRRPMYRRLIALTLMPLLPMPLWRLVKRLVHPNLIPDLELITPLTKRFRKESGAEERMRRAGFQLDRYQPWNRRQAQHLLFLNSDCETAEVYQMFEQLYGVSQRDPTAYRPFVEFCYGLPVELFVRDGEMRWLAKQLAHGIMPERQRANRVNGRWDSDWHLRLKRKQQEYLDELTAIERDPKLAAMIDVPRLRAVLEDMPQTTVTERRRVLPLEMAIPRAMQVARFVRYAEGRNDI
jgi:asparagine synthase (glutamine-hydrolysing)